MLNLENIDKNPEKIRQLLGDLYVLTQHYSVSISDKTGVVQHGNQKFFEMNGFQPDEIVGKRYEVIDPRTNIWHNLHEKLSHNQSWRGEIQSIHKDGSTFWTDALIIPLSLMGESDEGYLSVSTDITKVKSVVEQLTAEVAKKQNQLDILHTTVSVSRKMISLGTMASNIAHEINNPLSFVSSNLQTLSKSLREKPLDTHLMELPEIIHEMKEGLDRVITITENLKAYCLDKHTPAAVNINRCIVNALQLLTPVDHAKVQPDLRNTPDIMGSESHLIQVISNILSNACLAIGDSPGEVWVSTRLINNGKDILIMVSDTGCGIPEEDLPRIFDPFFTTRPPGEGVGLGLTVCADIIEAHGGSLHCASSLDTGTEVSITLPIALHAPVPHNKASQLPLRYEI